MDKHSLLSYISIGSASAGVGLTFHAIFTGDLLVSQFASLAWAGAFVFTALDRARIISEVFSSDE